MKIAVASFLLFISFNAFCQENSERKLQVVGTAEASVQPDLGILSLRLAETRINMSTAVQALSEKTNYYVRMLTRLKYDEKDIKTTQFSVNKNRVYRNNKYVDSGYVAAQNVRLEFVYTKETLANLLTEFSESEKDVDFSFGFKLSETRKTKTHLKVLEDAVANAKNIATRLAGASGTTLGTITQINYGGWNRGPMGIDQLNQENRYNMARATSAENASSNFTPEDITFRDIVTIEWTIK